MCSLDGPVEVTGPEFKVRLAIPSVWFSSATFRYAEAGSRAGVGASAPWTKLDLTRLKWKADVSLPIQ